MTTPRDGTQPTEPVSRSSAARSSRKRPLAKRKPFALALTVTVVVGFGALAVWLASQDQPRVTHGDALQMAATIENSTTAAQLEALMDFRSTLDIGAEMPRPTTFAELLMRERQSLTLTFLTVTMDADGNRGLLFRLHNEKHLVDYYEMRLVRRDGAVRVTDVGTMLWGGWWTELAKEAQGPDAQERQAFVKLIGSNPTLVEAEATFAKLSVRVRAMRPVRTMLLDYVAHRAPEQFRRVADELKKTDREHLAPELILLNRLGMPNYENQDVLLALGRIDEKVADPDFLEQIAEDFKPKKPS